MQVAASALPGVCRPSWRWPLRSVLGRKRSSGVRGAGDPLVANAITSFSAPKTRMRSSRGDAEPHSGP